MSITTGPVLGTPPPEQIDIGKSRRRMKVWGAVVAAILAGLVVVVVLNVADNSSQDNQLDDLRSYALQQQAVIGQVCAVAGGQLNNDQAAKSACERVQRGEPAITSPPAAITGAAGVAGVGVAYARQIDRCFVEIGLTSGSTTRFGPFCGEPGSTGPSGPTGVGQTGPTGPTGTRGPAGVGIASVGVSPEDHCYVRIKLTDGSTNDVGPFCGQQGVPGSTGPSGPKGDNGEPGPACGEGYHQENTTINGRAAQICFADGSEPGSSEETTTTTSGLILPTT